MIEAHALSEVTSRRQTPNIHLQGSFEMKMNMKRVAALSALTAGALTVLTLGNPAEVLAQKNQKTLVSSTLPNSIKRAAIATRSSSGMLGGARIGKTDHFVVYIQTTSGCGSGGCRAQIWELEGRQVTRKESLAVGRLPIVLLPEIDNGMPRLGVTTGTGSSGARILPIAYDGENYSVAMEDDLLARSAGKPLITNAMLKPYR